MNNTEKPPEKQIIILGSASGRILSEETLELIKQQTEFLLIDYETTSSSIYDIVEKFGQIHQPNEYGVGTSEHKKFLDMKNKKEFKKYRKKTNFRG